VPYEMIKHVCGLTTKEDAAISSSACFRNLVRSVLTDMKTSQQHVLNPTYSVHLPLESQWLSSAFLTRDRCVHAWINRRSPPFRSRKKKITTSKKSNFISTPKHCIHLHAQVMWAWNRRELITCEMGIDLDVACGGDCNGTQFASLGICSEVTIRLEWMDHFNCHVPRQARTKKSRGWPTADYSRWSPSRCEDGSIKVKLLARRGRSILRRCG
jgi:hypothetical protein